MFEALTEAQRAAATFDGGHLLIVAGAGTGKTATLTARLVELVERGVDPARILLLTFSRRAAAVLLQRATAMTGPDVARRCWGGTFHAVAHRLLRQHGAAIGLDPGFTLLDQADTTDLLSLVRAELSGPSASASGDGRGPPAPAAQPGGSVDGDGSAIRSDSRPTQGGRRPPKPDTMATLLSRMVNARTPLSEAVSRWYPWCSDHVEDLRATFIAYTARKRATRVADFDDLLLCWAALLAHHEAGPAISRRWDHVLVDEYQDTNALQAEILAGLAAGGARVTAVGDDAQAIYSFRAADHRNILEFSDRFGAEVLVLERNHRSTPPLLAASNALMAEARRRHEKVLVAARAGDRRPALVTCADEAAQSVAVCERLLERLETGIPLRRQAVLVRTGHHSDLLELELAVRRIPFRKYGGLRFLEAAHVKDLIVLLRLVENPSDELAWFRILRRLDGVGPVRARAATAALVSGEQIETVLPAAARPGAGDLVAALGRARDSALARSPRAQVEHVRAWLDPRLDEAHGHPAARLADLDQLTVAAGAAPSLARFLADLTLDPPASTGDLAGPPSLDDDVLTISTIHAAKGMEWDVVHVLHLADGNLPSDLATGDDEGIEEERRLLYVAMTRARDALWCYVPLRYHHHRRGRDDAHGYAQRSRFLTPAVCGHFDQECAGPVSRADPPVDAAPDDPPTRPALAGVDDLLADLLR